MELSENDDFTTLDTFPVISGVLREQSSFIAGEGVDDFLTPNSISL